MLSFGLFDGPDEQILGEVVSMTVTPGGDILVVDRQASRVGWIRSDGSLGGWFGRAGDGPHEFEYLGDSDVRRTGEFVVVDAGHKRLVVLSAEGDSLAFRRDVRLGLIPDAMCTLGDRVFVTGLWEGFTVHEVDWHGGLVRSFARPIEIGEGMSEQWNRALARYSTRSEIVCLEDHDLVVVLPEAIGRIRAFTPDGQLKWIHELGSWSQWQWFEPEPGRFQMAWDPDTGTANSIQSAWILDQRTVAIQVAEHDRSRTPVELFETRFLDLVDQTVTDTQDAMPRIAAFQGGIVFGWEDLPFPRIFTRRARLAGGQSTPLR